ncbi:MAG TPA: GNAT family protein [Solirubrobacteraceae bacterium]|nr:GNAT family protein [Solirubrobacteraceae bacterium]
MDDLTAGLGVLVGARATLRPTQPDDLAALFAIRTEPEVAAWWGKLGPPEEEGPYLLSGLTVWVGGAVAGWLEIHEEAEPMSPHATFDLFLGAGNRGRGVGREVLGLAIDALVERGHHRFQIDPAATNETAIRCYAAVGFRPVGRLREAERAPDGTWRDALLMDLLARERR